MDLHPTPIHDPTGHFRLKTSPPKRLALHSTPLELQIHYDAWSKISQTEKPQETFLLPLSKDNRLMRSANPHLNPLIAFLHFQRAGLRFLMCTRHKNKFFVHQIYRPSLFRLGNAHVLSPSRFWSDRRSRYVSAPLPPMSFSKIKRLHTRLRRFYPFDQHSKKPKFFGIYLPGILFFEVFSSVDVKLASQFLLSRTFLLTLT